MAKKQVKVIALVDEEQRRALYHRLLDEDRSFAEWLRQAIDSYLSQPTKPKGKADANR